MFAGVEARDLTFRRGVAGFFARGHNPPPPGAISLVELPGGEPVVYLDQVSSPGRILVHSGYGLLGSAGSQDTAGRVAPQLVKWVTGS